MTLKMCDQISVFVIEFCTNTVGIILYTVGINAANSEV